MAIDVLERGNLPFPRSLPEFQRLFPVGEELVDHGMAMGADAFGHLQTPLDVPGLPGLGLGRQMVVDRRKASGLEETRMGGDQLLLGIETYGAGGGTEPELLTNPTEGD